MAFAIFGAYVGYIPLFGSQESFGFHPSEIGYYLVIGVLGGLLGRAYATGFYGTAKILHRIALPRAIKPALAGLAVGALGLVVAQVLGTGYGWVQRAMEPSLLTVPLWIVLVAPVARIAATAFSIGSGGSGGIFGPGMVIGAFTGAAVWRVAFDLGLGVPHDASPGRPSPQGTSPACWSISTKWSLCAKCFPHPRSSPRATKEEACPPGGSFDLRPPSSGRPSNACRDRHQDEPNWAIRSVNVPRGPPVRRENGCDQSTR